MKTPEADKRICAWCELPIQNGQSFYTDATIYPNIRREDSYHEWCWSAKARDVKVHGPVMLDMEKE